MHQLHHASEALLPPMYFFTVWPYQWLLLTWFEVQQCTLLAGQTERDRQSSSPLQVQQSQNHHDEPAHKCFFALYSHPFWCPTLAWQLRARLHGWHAAHCTRERAKRMAATSKDFFLQQQTRTRSDRKLGLRFSVQTPWTAVKGSLSG